MTYRCFIAINLPQGVKEEIARVLQGLKDKNSSRAIAYTKPENIHITLHFLGNVEVEKIEELKRGIGEAVQECEPFHLSLSNFDAFPNMHNPRVLYLNASGEVEKARDVQRKVGGKLLSLGYFFDSREWVAHFTLARIKSRLRLDLSVAVPDVNFQVKSIELMRSQLSANGPRYSVLGSFQLRNES